MNNIEEDNSFSSEDDSNEKFNIIFAKEMESYSHIIKNILEKAEKKKSIQKKLSTDNNICVITHEMIQNGEYYYECEQCKKPFKYDVYKKWFLIKKMCCHCRKPLVHLQQLYLNNDNRMYIYDYQEMDLSISDYQVFHFDLIH